MTWLGPLAVAEWHGRLAEAHEGAGTDDPQVPLHHWQGAGDLARAFDQRGWAYYTG